MEIELLLILLIGLIGAIMMFTGDQLLYFSDKSFRQGIGKTAEEKLGHVAEVMSKLPQKRFCAGGLIGPIAAFVYCVGFYHLIVVTDPAWNVVALITFLLNCFGIICGGAFHSHFPYLGLFGTAEQKETRDTIVQYFTKLMIFTYVGEGLGFILMIIMIAFGKTIFPRWCAIITPGPLMLLKPLAARIPGKAGTFISGGWSNLISIIYYGVLIIVYLVG